MSRAQFWVGAMAMIFAGAIALAYCTGCTPAELRTAYRIDQAEKHVCYVLGAASAEDAAAICAGVGDVAGIVIQGIERYEHVDGGAEQ